MLEEREDTRTRWTRRRNGRTVYADTEEHVALVLRTLGIDESVWEATLDAYAERATEADSPDDRLKALAEAFQSAFPTLPVPDLPVSVCPACSALAIKPCIARQSSPSSIVYGRCEVCGHGHLVAGASSPAIYEGDAYFRRRGMDGSGYDAYEAERAYRESKGTQLLDWLGQFCHFGSAPSFLEVGSGFGFTRKAAVSRGFRTEGV